MKENKIETTGIITENMILERNIKQFPIYTDKSNKRKYVIDTDSVTKDIVDLR